jgi:hypothetical protein
MRKNIFILLLSFIVLASFTKKGEPGKTAQPAIQFESMVHDFGNLKQDEISACTFKYKNTGNAPLIITEVEKPCGCTIPEWDKAPLMPGKTAEIKVRFSPKEQPKGVFRKTLNVYSNIQQERNPILMIKGTIVKGKVGKKK